jgi:formylglycine-generating enzyme required for sulfatase activity
MSPALPAGTRPDLVPLEPALVAIPAGSFLMGSESGQDNERPIHRVQVDGFLLAACQVTNREFGIFLRATGSIPPPFWEDPNFSHPDQPVVGVSWFEAVRYCEWLAATTAKKYRLPTEAEWERAARGGRESLQFPWGNEPPQSQPRYELRWLRGPEPVGQSAPNPYGLHEMCENVHEWCSDWYDAAYYANSPDRNPLGPPSGTRRSSRGGSWRHHIKIARCSARSSIPPAFQYADYGFRVACDP